MTGISFAKKYPARSFWIYSREGEEQESTEYIVNAEKFDITDKLAAGRKVGNFASVWNFSKENFSSDCIILETADRMVNFKPCTALIAKCIEIKRSKVACKA